MSLLDPSVRDSWCEWTERFEGRVSWMYLDVRGLVTTGLGCLLADDAAAAALPWQHSDGTLATAASARAEWWAVKSMPFGPKITAARYRVPGCLLLTADAIDALALERLDANAERLRAYFPDLADYPPEVQTALSSIAYACGANFPATWPRFTAAVEARDWQTASDECRISEAGNPGVRGRNDTVQAMLRGLG